MTATLVHSAAKPIVEPAVALNGVYKSFGRGARSVAALAGVDLAVAPGEFVCLLGASGCGKTTLLNLVAGLDRPTAGEIALSTSRPAVMFQEAALMPWLTASRNVELALRFAGRKRTILLVDGFQRVVGIDVTDDRQHRVAGMIEVPIEADECLARERAQARLASDAPATDAMTIVQQFGQCSLGPAAAPGPGSPRCTAGRRARSTAGSAAVSASGAGAACSGTGGARSGS